MNDLEIALNNPDNAGLDFYLENVSTNDFRHDIRVLLAAAENNDVTSFKVKLKAAIESL